MTAALPSYRFRLLHLTAVWAYAVSQPIFALVDGNPDLILSRDATRISVALFAVLVAVVPPALFTAYAWLAGRYSTWIGDRVYVFALGACLAPVAARLLKPLDAGTVVTLVFLGTLVFAGISVYVRSRVARLFVGYSIVLPALSLVWFVHGLPNLSQDAAAAAVRVASPAPVIFIQLDEMAASSLMTRDGEIDAVRYPNFARLAREGTWYRNATTVHEWTEDAVPSNLTGLIGDSRGIAILKNHPDNLFTLLSGSYWLRVDETITRLCPRSVCRRPQKSAFVTSYGLLKDSLKLLVPRVFPESLSEHMIPLNHDISIANETSSQTLLSGLQGMLDDVAQREQDNVLLFTHQMLPHAPWRFLPSGTAYDPRRMDGWYPAEFWADEPWLVLQNYQRYLLQVGYVDGVIGRVLRRLDRASLYDRSLIVVVADHGVSFRAGDGRRPVTPTNLADITNVPLFVKYPDQTRRGVDSRLVRSVDILPTIADVLGIRLPWRVDGVSLLGRLPDRDLVVGLRKTARVQASRDDARLRAARASGRLHVPLDEMLSNREETLQHKFEEFGEGRDSLFRIGRNKALIGRDVSGIVERSSAVDVEVENRKALDVRRASGFLPARISCHVRAGRLDEGVELAIAVNGRVRGLTTWFWDEDGERAAVPIARPGELLPRGRQRGRCLPGARTR